MGKPTGFMEYTRKVQPERPPLERIADWNEFHLTLPSVERRMQAARCMDCGIPYCHTGQLIGGMVSGCPIHNLIPEWNDLIYKNKWKEAYERLIKTNNFPEFTGRVCPAPCEGSCTVGMSLPPVTIKSHECDIIDKAFEEGWVTPTPPAVRSGKRVAVVGSGPSGLACADLLNQYGHSITVFERADRPGGLLMYGIPNMKLDKNTVLRRIDILKAEGIVFKTNVEVSKDLLARELYKEFDAVVLCCGATKPRDLIVPGRTLGGVRFAMDFLRANTKSLLDSNRKDLQFIDAKGLDVIVIGGGDTGTDCVATSLRHQCRSVVQFEIMPKPSKERLANNPWPEWPKVFKVDYGQEEAIAVTGNDPRVFEILTKQFIPDENGNVNAVQTIQVEWKKDANNRLVPIEIPGSEKIWPAQLVLLCLGFLGPEGEVIHQLDIEQDERSNVKTPRGKYVTSKEGVFAAGDMRRGQSLVVWAIREGREVAKECHQFLSSTLS